MSIRGTMIVAAAVLATAACTDQSSPGGLFGSSAITPTAGGSSSASNLAVADQQFIAQAAYSGLSEVTLGQMAQQRGSTQAVRELGRTLVADHTRTNEELTALARQKGISAPTQPDSGRQAVASALENLSGRAFDMQFLQQQLGEHQMALALFENQAQRGVDQDLRAFAQRYLPGLRQHTRQIESMAGSTVSSR